MVEKNEYICYHIHMQIQGEITRITFHNEQNGYTVATLEHGKERTTVVGKFFAITPGTVVKLTGEFITNKTYGEQFSFTSFETMYPSSINGIQKFLGSGLIKGVGMITAGNIVKQFGKQSLEILEFQPGKLTEIKGISPKKAKSISESFSQYKHVQNVIIFLSEYGISTNLALKIYDKFKTATIDKIQENPYALIEAVNGIGFLTADKIAQNFGIKPDSKFRIRAGIVYTLKTASEKNGHTYLPAESLLQQTAKILNLDADNILQTFADVLETLKIEQVITFAHIKGEEIVALESFYRHEKALSQKIAMMNHANVSTNIDVSVAIHHFEEINKIKFHSEQINAIQTAINSGICVITGGPGTGKTTIIKCILNILDSQEVSTLLLAPTGRASKRMSDACERKASTIHRALAMDFESDTFYHNDQNPLTCDAVIIDEFSMVDVNLAYYLFRALTPDCKVIIVGDKDQLPSVGAGNVLDDIIKSGVIKVAELTQIFRQDENSKIITNAHLINAGEMPELDNSNNDFFFDTKTDLTEARNSIVSLVTTRLPKFLNIDPTQIQVLAPMKTGLCGVTSLNAELQNAINRPSFSKPEIMYGNIIFRLGDKVMQTANNYNMEYKQYLDGSRTQQGNGVFNGDMGYITAVNRETGEMTVTFEGNKVCIYTRSDIGQLSLAYAITIHKSQGSEFDAVVIPAIAGPSIIFNRNLIYTAVTRAKKLVCIVGEKRHLRTMIHNKFMLKRHTMLKDLLQLSDKKATSLFDGE